MEADDDLIWCVWPDGTYCSEEELKEMTHMSDDFERKCAVAYHPDGTPVFAKGGNT